MSVILSSSIVGFAGDTGTQGSVGEEVLRLWKSERVEIIVSPGENKRQCME